MSSAPELAFFALLGALALIGLFGPPWALVKLPRMLGRFRGQDAWSQIVAAVGCALLACATLAWLLCVGNVVAVVVKTPHFGMSEIVMTGDAAGLVFLVARVFLSPVWKPRDIAP